MISKEEYEKRFPFKIIEYEELKKLIMEERAINLKPHRMDRSKVNLLEQVARLNLTPQWVKIQQDPNLIKDCEREYTGIDAVHANRLVWFGLLKREFRSGLVRITNNGILFLQGKFKVPARIWVNKGQVHSVDNQRVSIYDVKNVILDKEYWDNYPLNEVQE